MNRIAELLAEVQEAYEKIWFIQLLDIVERTDQTLSVRLGIRSDLFVQVFLGEITGSLYFALIEGRQRIFGIDRESGEWHIHPFGAADTHESLEMGLEPKPLLKFLSRVEELLIEQELLV